MHTGNTYTFKEVLIWTRRDIYMLLAIATIPVVLYKVLGWTWLALPWLPIALLGTAVAFVVGFKNNASYDRMWEARRIWGAIVNGSRCWGIMVKDYVTNTHAKQVITDDALKAIHLLDNGTILCLYETGKILPYSGIVYKVLPFVYTKP